MKRNAPQQQYSLGAAQTSAIGYTQGVCSILVTMGPRVQDQRSRRPGGGPVGACPRGASLVGSEAPMKVRLESYTPSPFSAYPHFFSLPSDL